jgi:threonine synthase
MDRAFQKCINPDCGKIYGVLETLHGCPACGNLLDACYDWDQVPVPDELAAFSQRWGERGNVLNRSGVWRYRELLFFDEGDNVVTMGEANTSPLRSDAAAGFVGKDTGSLYLQHEGYNPTGSFKDNGMTAAFTHAKMVGASRVACASTGNTSASMAAYAALSGGTEAIIFIGSGKIAYGKLCQAMGYGGKVIQIRGNFDDAMARVAEACKSEGIYLMNSVNPFRLEGQKSIMFRALEGLGWEVPDWIVVPGGNLGNSSAFGKAFLELLEIGLLDRVPRIAIIVSEGASTLYDLVEDGLSWNGGRVDDGKISDYYHDMIESGRRPNTIASAIEISIPVNLKKALRALDVTNGVVRKVPDEAILDSQAVLGRGGFGCEPASAATVAGTRVLVEEGVIGRSDRIVCILTGHMLKDPDAIVGYNSFEGDAFESKFAKYDVSKARYANRPVTVDNDIEEILKLL